LGSSLGFDSDSKKRISSFSPVNGTFDYGIVGGYFFDSALQMTFDLHLEMLFE